MKALSFILICFCFFSSFQNSYGQLKAHDNKSRCLILPKKSTRTSYVANDSLALLQGIVVDMKSKETLPFVSVKLLRNDTVLKTAKTDFDGDFEFFISPNCDYKLVILYSDYQKWIYNIKMHTGDSSKYFDYFITMCLPTNIRKCTICGRQDKVIRINSTVDFHYSFKSLRKEKMYYKRIAKRGYKTDYLEGQEVLTGIKLKSDQLRIESCLPCCDLLFCKRDVIIF